VFDDRPAPSPFDDRPAPSPFDDRPAPSPFDAAAPPSPVEPVEPSPDPSPFRVLEDPLAAFVPLDELPRSFFAQPEPLKWIAGAANCLRIVPSLPHEGQKCGPGSLIPWRMSDRWSQAVHM